MCMTFVLHALQSKETARVGMDGSPMNDKKWTHERKKLLMSIRLRHESDFTAKIKKRSTIWQTIRREIQEVDNTFSPSVDEITRCFTNMLGTYRRIKRRSGTSEFTQVVGTAQKRKRNEIIEFLVSESKKQAKLLEALVESEKEKVNIEKEKVQELRSIRNLYEKILERNLNT
ncbi:uncharacterized protein LOC126764212 [Bactrocera neohumeralis]|uniref:uncharacterized protein LOC126764212 n=1 Tax=Bactrocera neohumeralis TaxID=98809 RepID=UPI0021654DBD|nr:uncharacterized protein LOC126764212 [Bactrocera neohumeralis]